MLRSYFFRLCAIVLIFVMAITDGSAFHIIGGEITYECLGSAGNGMNTYEFKMYIYRDCRAGNTEAAPFDPEAAIGIFRGNSAPYTSIENIFIPLSEIINVDLPEIECLIPPDNLCVERGFYTWTVNLPVSSESYHLTYQRCCRNSTISNIINPDESGATYTVEIGSLAQTECNNSPTFTLFPPIIVCVNQPVTFDHSAIDTDGDSLVYSLVSPLLGATQFEPMPMMPPSPPYQSVPFRSPVYTSAAPLGAGVVGGEPGVSIDRVTGEITGVPQTVGQFVVGVQVEEYRDGQYIGKLFRDFQFNVASCESLVNASLAADETIGDQAYAVASCGQRTLTFQNTSTVESQIFSYQWEFLSGDNDILSSEVRSPTITFPDTGLYVGTMYLNRGSICEDSATIAVQIFPETIADYTFEYDTCIVGPVVFTNTSTTEADRIVAYDWDFGGTGNSNVEHPIYNFPEPSTQPVRLTVTDNNGCMSNNVQDVIWQPAPQTVVVQPNAFLGCRPANIEFVNLSFPIDETYTFNWDFGDGNTSNDINPEHLYESSGIYDVNLEIISPIGCAVDGNFNSLIRVEEGPQAEFTFSPSELSSLDRRVEFFDRSIDASAWFWNFGNESFSTLEDPIYTFQDTGIQEVRLIITKDNGCQDTIIKQLDIVPVVRYHMPNAFTPNNDGINDEFLGKGVLSGLREFEFTIWNRWGELVFSTNNPDEGWNGRKNNIGENSPMGSYPYLITYREPRGQIVRLKGQANLIK